MSNDATKVFNTPHRDYNTHLAERAIRGAQSHAAWEQEHPNLAAWSYAAGAAPFVVASIPLVAGVGDALAGSAIGQGITNGLGLVTNAASNSTWLPWVDAAATSYFGAHGLHEMANGNFTPETALEVAPLMQMAKPMYNAGKAISNSIKTYHSKEPKFISELDWSPESWFGNRTGNIGYDAEDIAVLNSHIPEYHQIEQQAKANGTWLKMPDGSTWQGDPRSWVQMMSKDGEKLQQRRLFHGDSNSFVDSEGKDMTAEALGKGILWTSTNKHSPHTYGNNHYELTIPKDVPNSIFDAEGRFWNNLSAPSSYKYKDTNDVSYDLLKNDNTVTINNVVDVGSDPRWVPGRYGLPDTFSGEKIFDYYDRVFKGDDIIIGKDGVTCKNVWKVNRNKCLRFTF